MTTPQTQEAITSKELERLVSQIDDRQLREQIQTAMARLELHKTYGLRFERHIPEVVTIEGKPIKLGDQYFPWLTKVDQVAGKKPTGPEHILIESDNYVALKYLQYTHEGQVDIIYIDPPYNTGAKDWKYNDKFVGDEDSFRHSKWLSFMEKRLKLAKKLLSPTGIIVAAINDNEHHTLRLLMEEIFGASNFVANIVWQGGASALSNFTSGGLDYMIIFSKNKEAHKNKYGRWQDAKQDTEKIIEAGKRFWEESNQDTEKASRMLKSWFKTLSQTDPAKEQEIFCEIDNHGRIYQRGDLSANNGKFYEVAHPQTKKPCKKPNRGWGVSPEKMEELIKNEEISFGKDETTTPRRKKFLENHCDQLPNPYIYKDRAGATKQLESLFGKKVFPFPKDISILKQWLGITGPKNAVILDFFAGSGSTFQAVAELNKTDGGTRQCILVTNNESNICHDVTWERIKRVTTGTHAYPECSKKYEGCPQAHATFYALEVHDETGIETLTRGWMKSKCFTFRCTAELFGSRLGKPFEIIDLAGTEHHIPNECEYAVVW
jgi:adenine-specific DNA-methyltransferase